LTNYFVTDIKKQFTRLTQSKDWMIAKFPEFSAIFVAMRALIQDLADLAEFEKADTDHSFFKKFHR